MRGKRAKELRRLAKEVFNKASSVSGDNPNPATMYIQDKRGVIGLAPVCLRFVYRSMKDHYKQEKLNGI